MGRESGDSARTEAVDSREDTAPKREEDDDDDAASETSDTMTLWQAVRKYHRVTLYCVGLTSAILMYGFDYVIVGTVSSMPSFQ